MLSAVPTCPTSVLRCPSRAPLPSEADTRSQFGSLPCGGQRVSALQNSVRSVALFPPYMQPFTVFGWVANFKRVYATRHSHCNSECPFARLPSVSPSCRPSVHTHGVQNPLSSWEFSRGHLGASGEVFMISSATFLAASRWSIYSLTRREFRVHLK